MRKIFKNIASAACAAVMLFTSTVSASAADDEVKLPSGKTVREFESAMKNAMGGNDSIRDSDAGEYVPSGAVGVFKGDEVLYTGYFGCTDWENDVKVSADSVFEWGSITKTLVWVSIMQLKEQGKIDLNHDVRDYLPDGFFQHLSYDEPITVLDLMNHTGGWQESTYPLFQENEADIKPLYDALRDLEPAQAYRPGEVVAYSNYGASVAGYVVELLSGMEFGEYVRQNIFKPLGMEHTSIEPNHSDNQYVYSKHREMKSYKNYIDNRIAMGNYRGYVSVYPCGAAEGTLADLMTYAQALADKDAPLFQNKQTQEEMYTGTLFYGDSDVPTWAHGFAVQETAVRIYGHSGGTMSCQTNMMFDPESGTGVVAMVNEPNGNLLLNVPFVYAFGFMEENKYGSPDGTKLDNDCYMLSARSHPQSMMKFSRYLTAVKGSMLGEADGIGRNVYQQVTDSNIEKGEKNVGIMGLKEYPDGTKALVSPSVDMVYEDFYLAKLMLFTLYLLMGMGGAYMLLIARKLKKGGRNTKFAGSEVMTLSNAARLVSVVLLLMAYVRFSNHYGISDGYFAVVGIMQIVCMAVCVIGILSAAVNFVKGKEKKMLYVLSGVSNCICVGAMVFYQVYRFWDC